MNIETVNELYKSIVPSYIRTKIFDITNYPIIHGYNIKTSYRNGGKTTNVILWAMCANKLFGSKLSYIRTTKSMTTVSKIKTIFDSINTYTLEDGRNYIQHIYNDKYNRVYYLSREKRFVLAKEDSSDLEIKNGETIMYVHSIDQNDELRSGFADMNLDIILYDECIDGYATNTTLVNFCHIISTFFRLRSDSVIFMCCNMSTGNPVIFQQMGIYMKMQSQTVPYMVYTTEYGTRLAVEMLTVSNEISNERNIMNTRFFGFKIDGMDIIRGSSIIHEPYRELPQNMTLDNTPLHYYACGNWYKVQYASNTIWQPLFYISECSEPPHNCDHIVMTDDKCKAITTPYMYYGIMRDNTLAVSLCKHVRRQDVCFDNYLTYISIKAFYDTFKIPENI